MTRRGVAVDDWSSDMVLGAEIAMIVVGLMMLIRGKSVGANAVEHWQFRLLGGFLLTVLPVAFITIMVFGVIWTMNHPDMDPAKIEDAIRWPAMGIELGVVAVYVVIGIVWEKAIKRKAESQG